ncbi:MAG: DNA replication/repair protein RecF [Rhodanobacteraceae bacterium]
MDLLRVSNLRCFEGFEFAPARGINWLVGPNGAGKTTVLEAAYILSHGGSFRPGGRAAPSRQGTHEYSIYAEVSRKQRASQRIGLIRGRDRWQARIDGTDLTTLAPLFATCPVVYFGPESQSLIVGPAETRRNFLDWSVFHVEHESLDIWRMWRRALRQRNALLRTSAPAGEFEPWEHDLARLGGRIQAMRTDCLASLGPYLEQEAEWLVPELGGVRIEHRAGWDEEIGLQQQLSSQRERERERGFTQHGAHRADWWLSFERVARRDHLSRGQAKAIALVCSLAQTRWLRDRIGEYPLLCLDDLDSELDEAHAAKIVDWLDGKPLQAWLTATLSPRLQPGGEASVFHVEQGGPVRA